MKRVLRRLMKPDPRECEDVRRLFSDYADAALARTDERRVEEHVGMCPRCRQVLANLRHTLANLGHLPDAPGTADADEVSERLRDAWRKQA